MIEQRTQQYSEEEERRGRWDLKLCTSDCPRVSMGSRRQTGWRGRLFIQTSSALGGPGLYDTKHEKREQIPNPRDIVRALPAGTTSLAVTPKPPEKQEASLDRPGKFRASHAVLQKLLILV